MSNLKGKRCHVCGMQAAATHHVFYGKNRANSEKYRKLCTVPLCFKCHTDLHSWNQAMDDRLKEEAQKRFEEVYGHAEFMRIFGRNYIKTED